MQEQQQVGNARIVGYAVGIVMFIAIAAWRFFIR